MGRFSEEMGGLSVKLQQSWRGAFKASWSLDAPFSQGATSLKYKAITYGVDVKTNEADYSELLSLPWSAKWNMYLEESATWMGFRVYSYESLFRQRPQWSAQCWVIGANKRSRQ